jgi:Domain of unknown function (DUF4129)
VRPELRNASRIGPRTRASAALPLAVLLTVIVIAAAGIGGTSHFTGARWFPHLGGGKHAKQLTVATTPTTSGPGRQRPHAPGTVGLPLWLGVLAAVALAIGIGSLLLRLWRRRRAPGAPTVHASTVGTVQAVPAAPTPEPEVLLTGIELALRELDEDRDPADAVVRAWLGLQETAEESGIQRRGPAETPTEFATRVLRSAFADDRALRTLLRLYLRTRFGDHPVTPEDVAEVRAALQQLLENWRAADAADAADPAGAATAR